MDRGLEYACSAATMHKICFVFFTVQNFISSGPEKGGVIGSFLLAIWNIFKGKVENDISKLLAVYSSISFKVGWADLVHFIPIRSS